MNRLGGRRQRLRAWVGSFRSGHWSREDLGSAYQTGRRGSRQDPRWGLPSYTPFTWPGVACGETAQAAHDQDCDHHDIELIYDPDQSRLTSDHVVERGKLGSAIKPVT